MRKGDWESLPYTCSVRSLCFLLSNGRRSSKAEGFKRRLPSQRTDAELPTHHEDNQHLNHPHGFDGHLIHHVGLASQRSSTTEWQRWKGQLPHQRLLRNHAKITPMCQLLRTAITQGNEIQNNYHIRLVQPMSCWNDEQCHWKKKLSSQHSNISCFFEALASQTSKFFEMPYGPYFGKKTIFFSCTDLFTVETWRVTLYDISLNDHVWILKAM